MKRNIYGICIVKNEADIIRFSIGHSARFCHKIFVLDNGSSDCTWEIVQQIGKENPKIIPFEQRACPFGEGLRAYIFNRVQDQFKENDWVFIFDSDEFLESDPFPYIMYCENKGYNLIYTFQAQFYITEKDMAEKWWKDSSHEIKNFQDLPRHYLLNWKEPRLFQYRKNMVWRDFKEDGKPTQMFRPEGLMDKCPKLLVNRHYQYRSFIQMEKRINLRAEVHQNTGKFSHNRIKDITHYIKRSNRLKKVVPDRVIQYNLSDLINLYFIRKSKKYRKYYFSRTRANLI